MHTRVHADMPACLRTMAPRRALGGLKRAVRVRVLRRCCAPAFRAATVPVLSPWLALEGLARGAASGVSMAGAGAVGGGCRMRTRIGLAGYRVHGRGGRWYTPRCPGASTRGLHGQEFERGAHVRARTLTGGGAQVHVGRCPGVAHRDVRVALSMGRRGECEASIRSCLEWSHEMLQY